MRKSLYVVLVLLVSVNCFASVHIFQVAGQNSNGLANVGDNIVCIFGPGGIQRTTNAGLNWTYVYQAARVMDVKFEGNLGYAISNTASDQGGAIIVSTNAGATWDTCFVSMNPSMQFTKLFMSPVDDAVYALFPARANMLGMVWKKLSGSNTWQWTNFTQANWQAQNIGGDQDGTLFATSSSFLSTNNIDSGWTYHTPAFYGGNYGDICTVNNHIYLGGLTYQNLIQVPVFGHSTNKGITWESYIFPGSQEGVCWDVDFDASNSGEGYAVIQRLYPLHGYLYRTSNNGDSWQSVYDSLLLEMRSVLVTPRYVYASGTNFPGSSEPEVVVRYDKTLTGINPSEGINIKDYKLNQNYPNPFNPTTSISFNLPKQAFVSLKVYDMAGKEVATLVNETKNTGKHTVAFNAGNLSSGIYFYKIQTENFVETKKMMLVK